MPYEVHPVVAERAGDALLRWFDHLRPGNAMKNHMLTVVPVYQHGNVPTMPYRTLAEGIGAGEVGVIETQDVQTLRVENRGALPVLILDGEELAGGWQNRMASTSALVPAAGGLTMPVVCIEQHAWGSNRTAFVAQETAFPALRRKKLEQITAAYGRGVL